MAAKPFSDLIRVDLLTSQLIFSLIKKLSTEDNKVSKSEIYRSAIYRMAKEELSEEEFQQILLSVLDSDRI